jgi:hypothetical protein
MIDGINIVNVGNGRDFCSKNESLNMNNVILEK